MRIRYTVSTMLFWGQEHSLSLEQECQFLKSLGFGVELWPYINGRSECRYERRNWPRLAAATNSMLVVMRSRDDRPTLPKWNEQIECAKMLGANIVADLQGLGITNSIGPDTKSFVADVVKLAEQNKVKLCVETGRLPVLKKLGREFESLLFCLDTGSANLDGEFSFKQYVDTLAPRVVHLHLTDNFGRTDDHGPPGLPGGIAREKWDYLLNVLSKYDNDIVGSFEICPCVPDVLVRQASEFIFDVLKWPDRPNGQQKPADNTM